MTASTPSGITLGSDVVSLLRRHGLLRPLIERQVMAEMVASIHVQPELSQELLNQYRAQNNLGNEAQLHGHLQERGFRLSDLMWQLELPRRRERLAQTQFGAKAEQRFLQRKSDLDRVVYSLLRVTDPYLAQELYLRIADGEATFAALAAEFSEGAERQTQGIVGPVPLTQAHPVLADRLRTHKPGELQEPFRLENWWLVVRVEELTPAVFDETVALQMSLELLQIAIQEETSRRLSQLSVSGLEPDTLP